METNKKIETKCIVSECVRCVVIGESRNAMRQEGVGIASMQDFNNNATVFGDV